MIEPPPRRRDRPVHRAGILRRDHAKHRRPCRCHRENTAVHQREILFGEPGPYRSEALALIDQLEEAIGAALLSFDGETPITERLRPGTDAAAAAGSLFSVLHMELIRLSIGRSAAADLPGALNAEIDIFLHGILQQPPSH